MSDRQPPETGRRAADYAAQRAAIETDAATPSSADDVAASLWASALDHGWHMTHPWAHALSAFRNPTHRKTTREDKIT